MTEFLNPYHFVPVTERTSEAMKVSDFDAGKTGHVTHDRYVTSGAADWRSRFFSGRLVCRLTTESPMFIGSDREATSTEDLRREGRPRRVEPFELDGRPAIPASSLRGLISSIAEAASNSALRVLSNRTLSYRMAADIDELLPAIGMIAERRDPKTGGTTLRLLPLALPAFDRNDRVPLPYGRMFPAGATPRVKFYVNGYRSVPGRTRQDQPRLIAEKFLLNPPKSSSPDHKELWYVRPLGSCEWNVPGQSVKIPIGQWHRSRGFITAQEWDEGQEGNPLSEPDFVAKSPAERSKYTRCILRVLGIEGRVSTLPQGRKHEILIPFPVGAEDAEPTYDICDALATFHRLADERTDATADARTPVELLPYHVKESKRNTGDRRDGRRLVLRKGDIVFFKAEGDPPRVTAIAVSSIWRADAGRVHDYFAAVSEELLPFNAHRRTITVADALFGFVEDTSRGGPRDAPTRSLAGRVRFSFGRLAAGQPDARETDPTPLKVLVSPKPPSPPFYFRPHTGAARFIRKADLKPAAYRPQGRKVYLHHQRGATSPWRTGDGSNQHLKNSVRLIRPERSFYFHVDFDNLSAAELRTLCYAVRPSNAFRHKLGMGKAIGLGTVKIDPLGLFFVDREDRYGSTFSINRRRYHACWVADSEDPDKWSVDSGVVPPGTPASAGAQRVTYPVEAAEWTGVRNQAGFPGFDDLRDAFVTSLDDRTVYRALELLGDPKNVTHAVQTPQVDGRPPEGETYEWFVNNTTLGDLEVKRDLPEDFAIRPQVLRPLIAGPKVTDDRLPTLGSLRATAAAEARAAVRAARDAQRRDREQRDGGGGRGGGGRR